MAMHKDKPQHERRLSEKPTMLVLEENIGEVFFGRGVGKAF